MRSYYTTSLRKITLDIYQSYDITRVKGTIALSQSWILSIHTFIFVLRTTLRSIEPDWAEKPFFDRFPCLMVSFAISVSSLDCFLFLLLEKRKATKFRLEFSVAFSSIIRDADEFREELIPGTSPVWAKSYPPPPPPPLTAVTVRAFIEVDVYVVYVTLTKNIHDQSTFWKQILVNMVPSPALEFRSIVSFVEGDHLYTAIIGWGYIGVPFIPLVPRCWCWLFGDTREWLWLSGYDAD